MRKYMNVVIFLMFGIPSASGAREAPQFPFILVDSGAPWITDLKALPESARNRIARIQKTGRAGTFPLNEDLDDILAFYDVGRQAQVVDLVTSKTYSVTLASATFTYKDHGDCGQDYPDSIDLHIAPSDAQDRLEVYGFIKPENMALIMDLERENAAAFQAWKAFVDQHQAEWIKQWSATRSARDEMARIKIHPIVLKVKRPSQNGYIFIAVANTMNPDKRFFWDGNHFYPLSTLDYPLCGS